jgi:hypothetical protein
MPAKVPLRSELNSKRRTRQACLDEARHDLWRVHGSEEGRQKAQRCSPREVTCCPKAKIMFFFFSNRLGCLGSILVSAVITIGLLFLFGVFR